MSSENKPRQLRIDEALIKAANYRQWALAKKLYTMAGENRPSEPAIAYALDQAWISKSSKVFASLCEESTTPPSQATIESLLTKVLDSHDDKAWHYIDYLCLLPSANKPGQPLIDRALNKAAGYRKWVLAKKLYTMEGENKASEEAVADALGQAWVSNSFEEFTSICMESTTPPVTTTIESLLGRALASHDDKCWTYIEYLCSLSSENKPRQPRIGEALIKAANYRQWALAKKLYTMAGGNRPSEPAIAYALDKAWISKSLKVFASLCEESTTPPSQATIESLLTKVLDSHDDRAWFYIDYLCLSPLRNKPRQPLINEALIKAANYGQWALAKKLYTMKGNNRPGQGAIEHLLRQAATHGQLQIINDLFSFPFDRRPRIEAISQAFVLAASSGQLEVVRYIFEGDNKLSLQTFMDAFLAAAIGNQVNIIRYFLPQKPPEKLIADSLLVAAESGSLDVIKLLLSRNNPIAIDRPTIEQAFIKSFVSARMTVTSYFLDPKNGFTFEQKVIDQALADLAEKRVSCASVMIDLLFKLRRPSEDAMNLALEKAETRNDHAFANILRRAASAEIPLPGPTSLPKPVVFSFQAQAPSTAQSNTAKVSHEPLRSAPTFYAIFTRIYQPTKDFTQLKTFDSKERRKKTIVKLMADLKVNEDTAAKYFSTAYESWLDKPENEARKDQVRLAHERISMIMRDIKTLDGKVGWVGGETIKIRKNKEIIIAKGAATIFKHCQDCRSGIEPSALAALSQVIIQAQQSDKYQGHWFFNRRHEDVSRFYKNIMAEGRKVSRQSEEKQENSCCIL